MEFVSFEIAKKLKEKGFREKCFATYTPYGGIFKLNEIDTDKIARCDLNIKDFRKCYNYYEENNIDAPTISQAMKWLREEKEIYIVIQPFPTMATKNKICWSWDFKWNSNGAYIEYTSPDYEAYTTYEQAALTGIEYVLDNLI